MISLVIKETRNYKSVSVERSDGNSGATKFVSSIDDVAEIMAKRFWLWVVVMFVLFRGCTPIIYEKASSGILSSIWNGKLRVWMNMRLCFAKSGNHSTNMLVSIICCVMKWCSSVRITRRQLCEWMVNTLRRIFLKKSIRLLHCSAFLVRYLRGLLHKQNVKQLLHF